MESERFTILTVCTGNVCRSPLAEMLLRAWAGGLPAPLAAAVSVRSAGTQAPVGATMSGGSVQLAASQGLADPAHAARQLGKSDLAEADLILVATRSHRQQVARMFPRAARKTFTIREFGALANAVDTADLPAQLETVEDVRQALAAIARQRGLGGKRDAATDDIIDPYKRSQAVYDMMGQQLIPPLADGASQLFGTRIDPVVTCGEWTLSTLSVGPMHNNAYIITDGHTGTQLLIDAAAEPQRLLRLFAARPGNLVLTTHRHPDHWAHALHDVVAASAATTLAGAADADGIGVRTDRPLADGDTVAVGDLSLSVIALRGHTPGSLAVRLRDSAGRTHIFTGDSLFPGGVGKTESKADFASLYNDVVHKIFNKFDDETVIHPGHGPATTLGAERPHLAEWKARGW
ncbi:MBL fold metallo-hydrolase [Rarobacter incanus]|uniref:Protein-tyrosine-phosphatase n=1 Tax=Rarobacter incanus TaxID=153494 RepID=A0A542SM88_9MICO|nr:MBL fold metallo-hydrolase [Rarobacter incanus]TQK75749.1 protein-tyrosine-phosphatase [Rarobacter incanus]